MSSNSKSQRAVTKKRKPNPSISIEADSSNLPCDVIYNILSSLPVKSLFRFRCVSKPWRNLISDPQFAQNHVSKSTKTNRPKLLVSAYKSDCFYCVDSETSDYSTEKLYFPLKKYRNARILGSCNGLILLGLHRDHMFVLWNPSTRVYIRFSWPYQGNIYHSLTGLCYDSSVNDYKAVFTFTLGNAFSVVVLSIKSNSWKVITEFPYSNLYERSGVIVNGALHWVVARRSDGNSRVIVYLDSVEERFKEVPQPDDLQNNGFQLSVLGGCLCLYSRTRSLVEVWTMKEYGVKESWTKLHINLTTFPKPGEFRLLYLTHKGEVVAAVGPKKLVIYNPKENKFIHVIKLPYGRGFSAVPFVDSLLLPTREKMTTKQHGTHQV